MKKNRFKLITEYPTTDYRCGLRAGDRVQLKKDLIVRDHRGKPTGTIHAKGEIWTVLKGSNEGRIVVWFQQEDGNRQTWDDDRQSIEEWFEILD